MTFRIVGLSHKTAPIELREKLAFDGAQLGPALGQLHALPGVAEALIVSTCNRTELYCEVAADRAPEPVAWLAEQRNLVAAELKPHLYQFEDEQAVRHALRVASGLDSLVVGEPQILGQLKDAYRAAVDAGTVGKLLNRLMQFSFATAKLVRSETEIGHSPVSVAYTAVKLAQQIHGDLAARAALLIGAGDTITLVANHLSAAHIGRLVIANRSFANARQLAERVHGVAVELHALPQELARADVVVTSTASQQPIVTCAMVESALRARAHDPMFIVDLAVPRDVEASAGALDDVYLYSVDDLEHVVAANMQLRAESAAQAEQMIHLQVRDYMDWLKVQDASATINAFRARGEALRNAELEKARARLTRGDDPAAVLDALAHGLTNKLLHHPTARLRQAGGDQQWLRAARDMLGLDGE